MRSVDGCLSLLWCIGIVGLSDLAAYAAERPMVLSKRPLTVVEHRAGSISTVPYLQKLRGAREGISLPKTVPGTSRLSSSAAAVRRHTWPVTPSTLRVAEPSVKRIEGLTVPVFVMGLDRTSLDWFERRAVDLANLGAQGVVVQAANQDQWRAFEAEAHALGVTVRLLHDAAIVEGYGLLTYPTVMADPSAIDAQSRTVAR